MQFILITKLISCLEINLNKNVQIYKENICESLLKDINEDLVKIHVSVYEKIIKTSIFLKLIHKFNMIAVIFSPGFSEELDKLICNFMEE